MTNNGQNNEGFSITEDNSGENTLRIIKCDLCLFTNSNAGGMKRHIARSHKGAKRSHDERAEDSLDDREDKRPKIDDHFEPTLASTQITEDDELDEFDAALLAEENDYNDAGDSFVLSDDLLDKLGNDTHFDIDGYETTNDNTMQDDNGQQNVIESVLQADIAIMKVKLKALEDESKAKDLTIEEMQTEINNLAGCAMAVTTLENEIKMKNETIEAGLSRVNTLEYDSEQKTSRIKALEKEIEKKSKRENLMEKALKKRLKKNCNSNGVIMEGASDDLEKAKSS